MARRFDGVNDYLRDTTTKAERNGSKVTVALWVRIPTGATQSQFDRILSLGDYNTGQGGFEIGFNDSNSFYGKFYTGSTVNTSLGSLTFTRDRWTLLVLDSDNTKQRHRFFANLKRLGQASGTRLANAAQLTLGAYNGGAGNFGQIDVGQVAIWTDVLSDADRRALYTTADWSTINAAALFEYWKLAGTTSPEPATVGTTALTVNEATQVADPTTPAAPATGAHWTRTAAGRLDSDDFNRVDAPSTPGAKWTVGAGTWGINANKLRRPTTVDGDFIKFTAQAARNGVAAQALMRSDGAGVFPEIGAYSTSSFYLAQLEANGLNVYRWNGSWSPSLLVVSRPGFVANTDRRITFYKADSIQRVSDDEGWTGSLADGTLNGQTHIPFFRNGNAGANVDYDDFVFCTSDELDLTDVPAGHSVLLPDGSSITDAGGLPFGCYPWGQDVDLLVLDTAEQPVSLATLTAPDGGDAWQYTGPAGTEPALKVTQFGVELVMTPDVGLKVTQFGVEAVAVGTAALKVTQLGVELVVPSFGRALLDLEELRCPQSTVEILDEAGAVAYSFSPQQGIWGGDVFRALNS